MEEYLEKIRRHLPMSFADEEANEFMKYLSDAYLENLQNGKYQFAFKAFHMLYMTFIYKLSFFAGINSDATQVFDEIYLTKGETETIRSLLKNKGFSKNDRQKCENHITVRNHCSHASGKIEYNEKGIDHFIEEEIQYIERLQKKVEPELKKFLQNFLDENWKEPFLPGDFRNLFEERYFSIEDLKLISEITLSLFRKKSNNEKTIKQKVLYLLLIFEIQDQLENRKNLFLEKLPILMEGLPEKIKVEKDGNEDEIFVSEIIEEHLIPIIGEFSDEDRGKAETILKLT